MGRSPSAARSWIEAHGALTAATAATAASLPGLWFPFLSDDWHLVNAVRRGPPPVSAFEYFRPLYMASYWLDWRLWGARPALFHLTNLVLIAATAALVVVLIRRYTGDSALAAGSGLLFALHPSHVENAAWIAVRGDPLFAVPFLGAALAYDRWRDRAGFGASTTVRDSRAAVAAGTQLFPLAAALLFLVALFAKETAVALPVVLAAVGLVDRSRRPSRREWLRGILPLAALGAAHLLVVRPLALGGAGRSLTPRFGLAWGKQALGYAVAAIVPADVDQLVYRPAAWGAAGAAAMLLLVLSAWRGIGRVPRVAAASTVVFAALLGPSVVGFQDRYLFLPAAASCVAITSLVGAARRPLSSILAVLLAGGWLCGWGWQWNNWRHAGRASESLVAGLVEASRDPTIDEIEVVNMPFRVRHGSVQGDFRSALSVLGERELPVLFDAEVSLSSWDVPLIGPALVWRPRRAATSRGTGGSAGSGHDASALQNKPSRIDFLPSGLSGRTLIAAVGRSSSRSAGETGEDDRGEASDSGGGPGPYSVVTAPFSVRCGPYARWVYPEAAPGRWIETPGGWVKFEEYPDMVVMIARLRAPAGRAILEWEEGALRRLR